MERDVENRPLHLPAADFFDRDIPITILSPATWIRLHAANLPAVTFSKSAANRFSVPDMGALYVGADTRTCLLEKFGDSTYMDRRLVASTRL
jgi:hypothetical protein